MQVTYKGIVLENDIFLTEWVNGECRETYEDTVDVPEGVMPGVPPDIYNAYRKGRDSACVDIVIATRLEDGTPAVLMSKRADNVCYGGKWWIYGGALQSYRSIVDFIGERASKECGVEVRPQVLIGVYRTMSGDFVGSTLQPCYASFVSVAQIRKHKKVDDAHSSVRLFTADELLAMSAAESHWYPLRVANRVLRAMPSSFA